MNEEVTKDLVEAVQQKAYDAVSKATELARITDDAQFREAAEFRKLVNGFKKEAILKCKPLRDSTTKAWKEAIKLLDDAIAPFDQAMDILDAPMAAWMREQERLRRLEEERLLAEAKKQQEDDQIAMAEEAAKSGDHDRAEAILAQPVPPPAPVLIPKAAPVAGVSFVKYYGVSEVIDLPRLAQACLDGDAPMEAIEPNLTYLKKMATATKGTAKIPGVTFTVRDGVRS